MDFNRHQNTSKLSCMPAEPWGQKGTNDLECERERTRTSLALQLVTH